MNRNTLLPQRNTACYCFERYDYISNLLHCRVYIGGAEFHAHGPITVVVFVRLSIAPWTRAIRSSSDVTGVTYTVLFILPHRKQSRGVRSGDHADHGTITPSTNLSIWICNVQVIPHISIEVRRWLKGCIPAVLGHQKESEQFDTRSFSNFNARQQWQPTRGTRATSGTHKVTIQYINTDSQEFIIFWKYLPPSLFPANQTWSCDTVADSGRHTYVKKQFPS